MYQANRYDRAGAKAGLNQYDVYKGHSGPVMGVHFHPLVGPVDFSDLFLSCSVDWTVKLWRAKSLAKPSTAVNHVAPLYSFDEADDYVYDVKWHPTHPAVFGTVDGAGKFDLWNLNHDTEVRTFLWDRWLTGCVGCGAELCLLPPLGAGSFHERWVRSRIEQTALGTEGRAEGCTRWKRRKALYLRHRGYGTAQGIRVDRHAADDRRDHGRGRAGERAWRRLGASCCGTLRCHGLSDGAPAAVGCRTRWFRCQDVLCIPERSVWRLVYPCNGSCWLCGWSSRGL